MSDVTINHTGANIVNVITNENKITIVEGDSTEVSVNQESSPNIEVLEVGAQGPQGIAAYNDTTDIVVQNVTVHKHFIIQEQDDLLVKFGPSFKYKNPTGSLELSGSMVITGSMDITGSLTVSGSDTLTNYGEFINYGDISASGKIEAETSLQLGNTSVGASQGAGMAVKFNEGWSALGDAYSGSFISSYGNFGIILDAGNVYHEERFEILKNQQYMALATKIYSMDGDGNITASGEISASGASHILGNKVITTELEAEHSDIIKIDGNLTGSGDVYWITGTDGIFRIAHGTNTIFQLNHADDPIWNLTTRGGVHSWYSASQGSNLGIGTQSPNETLEVVGNISASGGPGGDFGNIYGKYQRPIETITADGAIPLSQGGTYLRCGSHMVTMSLNSAVAFPIGTEIELIQTSSDGHLMVTASHGDAVTINSRYSLYSASGRFSAISLKKVGTDEWDMIGDLTR